MEDFATDYFAMDVRRLSDIQNNNSVFLKCRLSIEIEFHSLKMKDKCV